MGGFEWETGFASAAAAGGGKVVIVMSYKHELNNTLITSRGTGILNVGAMNDDMY